MSKPDLKWTTTAGAILTMAGGAAISPLVEGVPKMTLFVILAFIAGVALSAHLWSWHYARPLKPMNLKRWGNKPDYEVQQLMALWYGYEPISTKALAEHQTAQMETFHREIDDAFNKGVFTNVRRFEDGHGNQIDMRFIPADQLRAWAASRNERPKFLFPGG